MEQVPHAVDPRRVAEHGSVVMRLVDEVFPLVEGFYVDLHKNPELSHQEHRTARAVAEWLGRAGFEIETGVGGTGVVGVLRNGDGPTVLLRGDMDALPLQEQTGLPYASTARGVDDGGNDVPVMHACGHDAHTACLVGTADLLASARDRWSGTLMVVAQPAEETIDGAPAVLGDGLYSRHGRPDIALAQHLGPQPAGMVSHRAGVILGATSTLKVRVFGSGGNASQPHLTVDPVVIASSIVARVQTVVGREISPSEMAVVTVGVLRAGTRANVIPDEAYLEINARALNETVARRLHGAIERIVRAEASAAGAPREPEIEVVEEAGVTSNDPEATRQLAQAHRAYFGDAYVIDLPEPFTGSEDFGAFGLPGDPNPIPYVYWFIGATPHDVWEAAPGRTPYEKLEAVPGNHSPYFAPERETTLTAGLAAMTVAALTYLGRGEPDASTGQQPAFLRETPRGTPVVDAPPPEELAEPVPGPPPQEYAGPAPGPPEEGAPVSEVPGEGAAFGAAVDGRFPGAAPEADPGAGGATGGGAFSEPAPDLDSPAWPAYDAFGGAAAGTRQDGGDGGVESTHAADMADLLHDDDPSSGAWHGGEPQPGSEYPGGPAFPAPPPQGPPVSAAPPPPDAEPYPGERPWSADHPSREPHDPYEAPEQPRNPPEDPPYRL
ncbi:amidohydrolase [Halostreptopolyspora alba]|uniref:Amidohydrolase n=1 Tax=Halostreptopolyspora alba TaxID=2487137 RepID=A0A3N0E9Y5_9ACTN|nr:amidohydrolase [Nocardiopsaceae bacterium YIM 96095]